MNWQRILSRLVAIPLALCAALLVHSAAAAADRAADGRSLRIRVEMTIDARYGVQQYLEQTLARGLPRRLEAALGPPSDLQITLVERFPLIDASPGVGVQPASPAAERALAYDKVLHLAIEEGHASFQVVAQDYDVRARYLCPPVQAEVRQQSHVVDRAVETILTAFSPTSEFQQIPDDPEHVLIRETLATTTAAGAQSLQLRMGDILIPVLRRDPLDGESSLPSVQVVPWTVLVVDQIEDGETRCRVVGSSRHPLGIRRRGRIEQLAVAVRPAPAPVTLRLMTQIEPPQPLPGCSIYVREGGYVREGDERDGDQARAVALGVSDQAGRIEIRPSGDPVQLVWIKSHGVLLGKLPIVFGVHDSIDVPLADDPARVRAEADLAAVRTELVDLVARRNILLARSRAALRDGDVPLAQRLADELDRLPTRSQFNQRIDSVAQSARSKDRVAQRRIDQLVEQTRSVLAQYLDPREIGELRSDIVQAARRRSG